MNQAKTPARMGRPPITDPALRKADRLELRLTIGQRAKLDQLGGAAWVRAQIDKAKLAPARSDAPTGAITLQAGDLVASHASSPMAPAAPMA